MKYGSVCSGIEAATVAWEPLGWKAQWYSEIEPFPCTLLNHHYPTVPNLGDMTKIHETETFKRNPIDLLVGGTPCQSFSVAGLRKGMDDPRGNLALVFLGIADKARPRWVVWENVPGVLSSNNGRDFGAFLGGLGQLGYGFAYRVLDAQYFGVAQRRNRVFVVGHLGDWRPAAAVLFERACLFGDNPPSREARKGTPPCFTTSADGSGREDTASPTLDTRVKDGPRRNQGGTIIQVPTNELCPTLQARDYKDINTDDTAHGGKHIMVYENHPADSRITECKDGVGPTVTSRFGTGGGNVPIVTEPIAFQQNSRDEVREIGGDGQIVGALSASAGMKQQNYIAFGMNGSMIGRKDENGPNGKGHYEEQVPTLTKTDIHAVAFEPGIMSREGGHHYDQVSGTLRKEPGDNQMAVATSMQVRRLTPKECERLQGFPDDYTLIPVKNKMASDAPRYKSLGNSMAVPVMAWIGKRIEMVSKMGVADAS